MNAPPEPTDPSAQLVRETDERPVVRDSQDNPVVRFRDLERVKSEISTSLASSDNRMKIGFAVIGAIGIANLLGIRTADHDLGSTTAQVVESIRAIFALIGI